MASMAQSTFMKESEEFAGRIQNELSTRINSKNRGVKQAGFYVLIGASMPNVLIEVGFLSNPIEEKKLKKNTYRQQISEAIYGAILQFKKSKEVI
jgi:N-acetylmuramoyl-L-alanine amidase